MWRVCESSKDKHAIKHFHLLTVDDDPDPRPIVIELHSLIDSYLDLTHRNLDIQYGDFRANQQFSAGWRSRM